MFRFLHGFMDDIFMHIHDAFGLNNRRSSRCRGISLVYLLIQLMILHIMLALALPNWDAWVQREKELELIWRGEQYVQAINYYFLKYHRYPPNITILVQQHFLRRAYPDPFRPDGKWNLLTQINQGASPAGQRTRPAAPRPGRPQTPSRPTAGGVTLRGGIIGVASLDEGESIIVYQNQRQHNLWRFVYIPRQVRRQPIRQPRQPGRQPRPQKPPLKKP